MSGIPDRPLGDCGFIFDGELDARAAMLITGRQAAEDIELFIVELGELFLKVVVGGVIFGREGEEWCLG